MALPFWRLEKTGGAIAAQTTSPLLTFLEHIEPTPETGVKSPQTPPVKVAPSATLRGSTKELSH